MSDIGEPSDLELDFEKIRKLVKGGELADTSRFHGRYRPLDGASFSEMKIRKLYSAGLEFELPEGHSVSPGQKVEIEILASRERSSFAGLVLDVADEADARLVSVKFSPKESRADLTAERRVSPRWVCHDSFVPIAYGPNPDTVNDYLRFIVRDISMEGMLLVSSLTNKKLYPGRMLKLSISFPMCGELDAIVRIMHCDFTTIAGRDALAIGVQFARVPYRFSQIAGSYIFQFSSVFSVQDFEDAGFDSGEIDNAVRFRDLNSQEELMPVLKLRLKAHRKASQLAGGTTEIEMADRHDNNSRIIVGSFNGQIVASARVRYLTENPEGMTTQSWPVELPRLDEIQEVGRLVIDPEFQHKGLAIALIQHIASSCVTFNRPYIMITCLPKMLAFYSRMGFRDTSVKVREHMYDGEMLVLLGDMSTLKGKHVSPIIWNLVWRPAYEHLAHVGLTEAVGVDALRIRIYKFLSPLSWAFSKAIGLRNIKTKKKK